MLHDARRALFALMTLTGLAAPNAGAQARKVALILDQDSPRFASFFDALRREILSFFRPGEIELLPNRAGDGTVAGIQAVLDRSLRDSTVSVVVTMGAVGSHLLARAGSPARPAIAAMVIDAAWQSLPQKDGASGVARLAYVDQSYPVAGTLAEFRKVLPFRKLAVLLDRDLLRAIPTLAPSVTAMVQGFGAEAVIVFPENGAAGLLAALPADADAAFISPLPTLGDAEFSRLLDGLAARKLPTLSYLAEPDVRLGALASYEPPENWRRRARRVAVDLQRILAGEDAGRLPVRLVSSPRLTLNLETARRIGFSPGWSVLTEAELIGRDSAGPADTLGLADAMHRALEANLDLAAANLEVASGAAGVGVSRASLLPQIGSRLTETFTRKENAAASLGQTPERRLDGSLSLSLPLYDEQDWASYGAEKKLQEGRVAERRRRSLDVALDAGEAFLNVLRATTQADVQRSNLLRTRANLEVARLREGVGTSSRADIYRWDGEVANARRSLIDAEAQVRVASLRLAQVLNRPLDRPLANRPVSLGEPRLLAMDSSALTAFDQPARFAALTRFLVAEAFSRSPELRQMEASIAAQKRQLTATGRAFWLPALSLEGGLGNVFGRGGAGATVPTVSPEFSALVPKQEDLSWQFKLQASLPLFTGFGRGAARARSGLDLERLGVEREGIRQQVEQRVRAALETAASAYAAIALTRDAAVAADRNYALVTDAYASGAANITTLLDAQTTARNSAESAANAVHDFLLDLLRVERAIGHFGVLDGAAERAGFERRLQAALTGKETER